MPDEAPVVPLKPGPPEDPAIALVRTQLAEFQTTMGDSVTAAVTAALTASRPLDQVGTGLITAGVFLLILAGIGFNGLQLPGTWVSFGTAPLSGGTAPAIGLVLIAWGFVFREPATLSDGSGQGPSAMRLAMLLIISVFGLCAIREGWSSTTFEIPTSWIGILTAAIGGKAAQSFAENQAAPTASAKQAQAPK